MNEQKIAEALVEIQNAQASHKATLDRNAELERLIQTANDRVDFVLQENFSLKADNKRLRRKVIKLATIQSSMHLLAREGAELLLSMGDDLAEETPEEAAAEQKSAAEMVDRLPPVKI